MQGTPQETRNGFSGQAKHSSADNESQQGASDDPCSTWELCSSSNELTSFSSSRVPTELPRALTCWRS